MKKILIFFVTIIFFTGCQDKNSNSGTNSEVSCVSETNTEKSETFALVDRRIDKFSLNGKYISDDAPDVYFEVGDEFAVICDSLLKYASSNASTGYNRIAEIIEEGGEIWLSFSWKEDEGKHMTDFYYEEENTFSWSDSESVTSFRFTKQ